MIKITKSALAIIFFILGIIVMAGCETTKNVFTGISEGIPKDLKNTWQAMQKADNWIKKNLW